MCDRACGVVAGFTAVSYTHLDVYKRQPDMRLVPTDKSKEEILAWEMEGTRDEEIHKILSVLQPLLAEADSIPFFGQLVPFVKRTVLIPIEST